jgi:hypothetical protein
MATTENITLKTLPELESVIEAGHAATIYDGYPDPAGDVIKPDPSIFVYKYKMMIKQDEQVGYIFDFQGRISDWATFADLVSAVGMDVALKPIWMIGTTTDRDAFNALLGDIEIDL